MITKKINKNVLFYVGRFLHADTEYYGLSSDEKPVEKVENASIFYEMDTQAVYMFDAQNNQWIAQ